MKGGELIVTQEIFKAEVGCSGLSHIQKNYNVNKHYFARPNVLKFSDLMSKLESL